MSRYIQKYSHTVHQHLAAAFANYPTYRKLKAFYIHKLKYGFNSDWVVGIIPWSFSSLRCIECISQVAS